MFLQNTAILFLALGSFNAWAHFDLYDVERTPDGGLVLHYTATFNEQHYLVSIDSHSKVRWIQSLDANIRQLLNMAVDERGNTYSLVHRETNPTILDKPEVKFRIFADGFAEEIGMDRKTSDFMQTAFNAKYGKAVGQAGILKYSPSGQIDTTFGENGFVLLESHYNRPDLEGRVAIDPLGRVFATIDSQIVGPDSAFRLHPSGNFDKTFGMSGMATVFDSVFGIGFKASGTPILAIAHEEEDNDVFKIGKLEEPERFTELGTVGNPHEATYTIPLKDVRSALYFGLKSTELRTLDNRHDTRFQPIRRSLSTSGTTDADQKITLRAHHKNHGHFEVHTFDQDSASLSRATTYTEDNCRKALAEF